jgi:hypothetical protein
MTSRRRVGQAGQGGGVALPSVRVRSQEATVAPPFGTVAAAGRHG